MGMGVLIGLVMGFHSFLLPEMELKPWVHLLNAIFTVKISGVLPEFTVNLMVQQELHHLMTGGPANAEPQEWI